MRILFVGAVRFSAHCLREVHAAAGDIAAVVTPTRKAASFNSDYEDLGPIARDMGVPLYRTGNINEPAMVDTIRSLSPDIIFVFGFSQLIGSEILHIPPLGCVGTHPALLPEHRGRHPLIWALVEDLTESGLTFFYLDEGADSGDILWQRPFRIDDGDDAGTLYDRIMVMAGEAVRELLPRLERGSADRVPQDPALATYWRKRTEADGEVCWSGTSRSIFNLIRALTRPYVGAHTYLEGEKVLLWSSVPPAPGEMSPLAQGAVCGQILDVGDSGVTVRAGDGVLLVKELEPLAGQKVATGKVFGKEEG